MAIQGLQELITLQSRLTDRANVFLAYFGLSEETTFSQLDQAYKNLPNALSLGIFISLPSGGNLKKALEMERELSPLVQVYSGMIDSVYNKLEAGDFPADEQDTVREFVERSDLFLAYLSVYFRFLWNQLTHEEQRRILAEQLSLIERELLNLDISPNMLLALNQTKTFRKQGAQKHAKKLVKEFIQRYEDLTQKHRQLSQEIFNCYDVTPAEPWFCPPTSHRLKERDKWRSMISHTLADTMSFVQDHFEKLVPQRNEDGSALYYSDELATHLNALHDAFQRLDLESYLDDEQVSNSKRDDLSLKSAALTQLARDCTISEEQLSHCMTNLSELSLGIDPSLLPSLPQWVEESYSLENALTLAKSQLEAATKFLGQSLSTDCEDYSCLDPLGNAIDRLKEVWSEANKVFLRVRDVKKDFSATQLQNAKNSSFLEKVSLPSLPQQPYRSPSEFACWFKEIKDLIGSRRAGDQISLRSLKQACLTDNTTTNLLKWVDSYENALAILKQNYLPQTSLGPDIAKKFFSANVPAKNELDELKYAREFLSYFRQMAQVDLNLGQLGLPALYQITGSLLPTTRDRWEQKALEENFELLSLDDHFKELEKFLNFIVLQRQSQLHKKNLRKLLVQNENKPQTGVKQQRGNGKGSAFSNSNETPPKGSQGKSKGQQGGPPKGQGAKATDKPKKAGPKCHYCSKEGCWPVKCPTLSQDLVSKPDCYEKLKGKGICISCGKAKNNTDGGGHQCNVLVKKQGRETFNVLCEKSCKYQGVVLNRAFCRCRIAQLKAQSADSRSNNIPPPASVAISSSYIATKKQKAFSSSNKVVFSSNNEIRCNNVILGSTCRCSESLMLINSRGEQKVCTILYDTGGSVSLCRPPFAEESFYQREDLGDSFELITENATQTVRAVRYKFAAVHQSGSCTTFEALRGSDEERHTQLFTLLETPAVWREEYQLPDQFEIPYDNHDVVLGIDAQFLLPTVLAQLDNVILGQSRLSGKYLLWSVGDQQREYREFYHRQLPGAAGDDADSGQGPTGGDSRSTSLQFGHTPHTSQSHSRPAGGTGGEGDGVEDYIIEEDPGEKLARISSNNLHLPLSDLKCLNVSSHLVTQCLLDKVINEAVDAADNNRSRTTRPGCETVVNGHPSNNFETMATANTGSCDNIISQNNCNPTIQDELVEFMSDNLDRQTRICGMRECNLIPEACQFLHKEENMKKNILSACFSVSGAEAGKATGEPRRTDFPSGRGKVDPDLANREGSRHRTVPEDGGVNTRPAPCVGQSPVPEPWRMPPGAEDLQTGKRTQEQSKKTFYNGETEKNMKIMKLYSLQYDTAHTCCYGNINQTGLTLDREGGYCYPSPCQVTIPPPGVAFSSNSILNRLTEGYGKLSLRDQEFFLSNDLVNLLSVSGGRRRCEICQNCRRCSLSLAFTSFEAEQETTECRKNIRFDGINNHFVVNFCFYPKEKMKGTSVEDLNSHLGLATKRFFDLEAKTIRKFSAEIINATNEDVQTRFDEGQYCTLSQMRALDPNFDSYKQVFHPLCIAIQPAKGLHMVRICQDPSTVNKNGFSFNNFLLEGKSLHCELMTLMLRVRRSKYLAQSDVSRYYNRCWLEHWGAAMSGFIWRKLGSQEEPQICFSRVLNFGIKNASLLAALCLQMAIRRSCEDKGLTDFEQFCPYIDDLFILESQDIGLLYQRMEHVKVSLEKCSFPVKKFQLPFSSIFVDHPNFAHMLEVGGVEVEPVVKELFDIYKNTNKLISPQEYMTRQALLLPELPPRLSQEEDRADKSMYSDQFIPDKTVCTHKILGSHARLHSDSVSSVVRMNISPSSRGAKTGPDLTFSNYEEILDSPQFVKRSSLSLLMSFWDPPGTYQPMVTNFKYSHKLLLLLKPDLRWNDQIPKELRPLYKYLVKESLFLNPFPVKRFLTPDHPELYEQSVEGSYDYQKNKVPRRVREP